MNSTDTMIQEMADTMLFEGTIALDDCRIREDLCGLYQDIRSELRQKAQVKEKEIYAYAALLQREVDLCNPRMAYEAGAILGCNPQGGDSEPERAFMRYMCRVGLDPEANRIQTEIRDMYSELCGLLGDTHTLMDEFTELYRKCHGILSQRIYDFFLKGYNVTGIHLREAG